MWGSQARRAGGTQYDVQLLPTGKIGMKLDLNLIEGLAMTKTSKDKDSAWDVMKWIASDSRQKRIAEGGRMCIVPDANRKFWLPEVQAKYNVGNADAFLKAIEGATINLVGEITEHVINRDAGLSTAITSIRDGKATVKEALELTQPKLQQLLDSYWASQPAR
jgi:ABC-type glycerol-3-phosphate transport system substrate-binding protein